MSDLIQLNKMTAHEIAKTGKVVIWGFGQEGQACYQYLQQIIASDQIWILTDEYQAELAEQPQYIYAESGLAQLAAGDFNLVIKSPGISLYRKELIAAQQNGSVVSSSTNLWFERYPQAKTIIVTGTKGKSTTASMLGHLMQSIGLKVVVAGNLGIPLISVKPAADYTILELSSYQLADLQAHCSAYILLNLYQEHVPWHTSAKQYYLDKTKPAREQHCDLLICNAESELTQQYLIELAKQQGIELQPVYFNQLNNKQIHQAQGFYCRNNQVFYQEEVLQFEFNLKGEHNLKNLTACLTLMQAFNLNWRAALPQLNQFNALAHRLEEHVLDSGVIAVNDSISTTPDSTLCALNCYVNKPVYLILGGQEREQDYQPLIKQLNQFSIKHIALIGVTGKRIEQLLNHQKPAFSFNYYQNLTQALAIIKQQAQAGDVVLLSPAAPSFGEFKNYQHRGEQFLSHLNAEKIR
ncbi:UDP-N-acetylmuramoyl-L-alanine--D-glutamate ligase [Catenovulum sp. 2E275]|uniref:UDP-N-acetylmuramoyl-L-alanine--D-glutamate ligase n=1 Tax=Catenovulum sp. 2E275 TaxID=2980497 RepID=UPI0021D06A66|nr:UDP-N-acetylmuramoyl-L-alanine--D-glutamate ligase [Catenovulum sp. 2E275]MCU4675694.1 UDP-N-acetylmuramoyl-L-alanine--D-glutamate ligase [Catenovulum sp. 2E275]